VAVLLTKRLPGLKAVAEALAQDRDRGLDVPVRCPRF
jgi:hypothetical protein